MFKTIQRYQFILLLALFGIKIAFPVSAPPKSLGPTDWQDLTPPQQEILKQQKILFLAHHTEESDWPEVSLYALVPLSAQESLAYLSDFELHPSYVPDLLKAKILRADSPREVNVAFEKDLPWPLSNAEYVMGHHLRQMDTRTYLMTWKQIYSNSAKASTGLMKFSEIENIGTLFIFRNLVVPESFLATLVKNAAIEEMQEVFAAMVEQLKKVKQQDPVLLKKQVKKLNSLMHRSSR